MSRKHVPDPMTVRRMTAEIIACCERIAIDFEWLYPSGFHPTKRGGGSQAVRRSQHQPDIADAMVGDMAYVRDMLADCGHETDAALVALKGALGSLGRIQTKIDGRNPVLAVDDRRLEHPAVGKDVADARAAQRRRMSRIESGKFGATEEQYG